MYLCFASWKEIRVWRGMFDLFHERSFSAITMIFRLEILPSFESHIPQFQSGCAIIAAVVIFDQAKIIRWRKSQHSQRHGDAANSDFPFAYLQSCSRLENETPRTREAQNKNHALLFSNFTLVGAK